MAMQRGVPRQVKDMFPGIDFGSDEVILKILLLILFMVKRIVAQQKKGIYEDK